MHMLTLETNIKKNFCTNGQFDDIDYIVLYLYKIKMFTYK